MVVNPLTIGPDATLADALDLMGGIIFPASRWWKGTADLIRGKPGKLVGILTNRDVRFAKDPASPCAS